MADTVATKVLFSATNKKIYSFTNISDGTGESNVNKVDISALTGAPTKVRIDKVFYAITGGAVKITFDHTADDTVLLLGGHGKMSFEEMGGLYDPASSGDTGDIFFTTIGTVANDTYTIILEIGW